MSDNKSIILLSGGLDSLVALGVCKEEYGIELALTFDYGQKTSMSEVETSKKICEYYKINHKVIKLDWLKEITQTALVSKDEVPNRNGLFLNIAASFADSYGYNFIIFGANKDEGETFPDNTEKFRERISDVFEYSTLVKPRVVAPLINYSKDDIVKIAIEKQVPLEFVRSCYSLNNSHCGLCESCKHLKRALLNNKADKYIKILFGE